jgi:hypothetical protein
MRSIRKLTVGLALAASLSTAAVGLAGAASATQVQPAAHSNKIVPIKSYRTWEAAQKAAGFPLLKPTRTFGLKLGRPGIIVIHGCPRQIRLPASKQVRETVGMRNRQVLAMYRGRGRALLPLISFWQRNSGRSRCALPPFRGRGRIIAKVRVDGVVAILSRAHASLCIVRGNKKPKCRAVVIWQLGWTKHGHFYQVSSPTRGGQVRVIGFARSLVPVS